VDSQKHHITGVSRNSIDIAEGGPAPIASEALARIAAFYAIVFI
jgi:hypothetical protein